MSDHGISDHGISDLGSTPERPIESPAVPTDEVEVDPIEVTDDDHPVAPRSPGRDWESDPLDAFDQQREVPLDDER
jgi:hypothetical protein